MADTRVDIPGVGPVDFPDSMSPEDINAAAKRLYDGARSPSANTAAPPTPLMRAVNTTTTALKTNTGKTVPASGVVLATKAAAGPLEQLATTPGVTERLVDAGKGVNAVVGAARAANDLYEGNVKGAVAHATEAGTPYVLPLAWRAMKRMAGDPALDEAGMLSKVLGKASKVAEFIGGASSVLPGINAIGAEGDALTRLNSPDAFADTAKLMAPEDRQRMIDFFRQRGDTARADAIAYASHGTDVNLPSAAQQAAISARLK